MEENLKILETLETFKGGDNYDVPIEESTLDNTRFIVKECAKHNLPQPKIFPHAGGVGINVEWEELGNWHLVFSICGYNIEMLYNPFDEKRLISLDAVNCFFKNSSYAFNMAKLILTSIYKEKL